MFKLLWPWALLLLPLPLLTQRLLKPKQKTHSQALKIPFFKTIQDLLLTQNSNTSEPRAPLWLMWLCLLAALSGPVWVGAPKAIKQEGRNLMLALDLSGSMQIKDMSFKHEAVSRLFVVKETARKFITQRVGDRLALILFGTQAYLQTPLTFDTKTLLHMLDDATVGLAGQTTAIGDAIGLGVKRLQKTPKKARVLVLLTDGVNNAGTLTPLQAAKLAKDNHIKIYTIGLGADEMVVQSIFGPQLYNPSKDLNEKELKAIAKLTGGQFFRAKNFKSLQSVYQTINKLEPVIAKSKLVRPITDYYYWPLSLGFLIFLIMLYQPLLQRLTASVQRKRAYD